MHPIVLTTVVTLIVAWLPGYPAQEPEGRHLRSGCSGHLAPNLGFETPIYTVLPVEVRESLMRSEVFDHGVFRHVVFEHRVFEHRGPSAAPALLERPL